MNQPTGRLVFVSHSGEDTWVARQIARGVSECGAHPFLDEADVEVGAEFEEDIREFLDRAHELLVLVTPWSLKRPYVWAEIGAAWIRRIPIVVVLHGLSRSDFQAQPKPILRNFQWIQGSTPGEAGELIARAVERAEGHG